MMHDDLRKFDWSFLTGKELTQICVGLYQVQLHFLGDVQIHIDHDFRHGDGNKSLSGTGSLPEKSQSLTTLLGATVVKAIPESSKVLMIQFSNNQTLRILARDHEEPYESFQVHKPGGMIVV